VIRMRGRLEQSPSELRGCRPLSKTLPVYVRRDPAEGEELRVRSTIGKLVDAFIRGRETGGEDREARRGRRDELR
jgi:hypothetical protein